MWNQQIPASAIEFYKSHYFNNGGETSIISEILISISISRGFEIYKSSTNIKTSNILSIN